MNENDIEPFSRFTENRQLLNAMFFKEKMSKYSRQVIDQYYKSVLRAVKKIEYTRETLDFNTIQQVTSDYLKDMQWTVKHDSLETDFDANYRFDLVARKEKKTILVEVLPEITQKSLTEIQKNIFDVKREFPSTRLILAVDILHLPLFTHKNPISEIFLDMVKKSRLGLLLTEKNAEYQESWLVPAEFFR